MLANYEAKIKLNRVLAIKIEEEERRIEGLRTLNENLNVEYVSKLFFTGSQINFNFRLSDSNRNSTQKTTKEYRQTEIL